MTPLVTIAIAARNEMFLVNTIEDLLKNRRGEIEIYAVLDGGWPCEPIRDHPNVHVLFHPVSVGQRAAVNEVARLARGKYFLKLDAHEAVDEGFDLKLAEPYEAGELEQNVTTIPRLYNLHAYSWVCSACKAERYQGPTQEVCAKCGAKNTQTREIVWKPRLHKMSDFCRFDHDLHFQYDRAHAKLPTAQGDICDVMGGLGDCFFLAREQFIKQGGLDERYGSWGGCGTEVSLKAWLSGGRQIVNKRVWRSHMFRTQGSDFGFPYHLSNADVERARAHSRWLWLGNNWEGQVRPLLWVVDHFKPCLGWHEPQGAERLALITKAGAAFALKHVDPLSLRRSHDSSTSPASGVVADGAEPERMPADGPLGGQEVPVLAVRSPKAPVDVSGASGEVVLGADKGEVGRIGARSAIADSMVHLGYVASLPSRNGANEPSVHEPVDLHANASYAGFSVSATNATSPDPATSDGVDLNLGEDTREMLSGNVRDGKVCLVSHSSASCAGVRLEAGRGETRPASPILPPSAVLYYTDSKLDPYLSGVVQRQLRRACGDRPIYCVSLQPVDFGDERIVLSLDRSNLTMFKQQLAGLEAMDKSIQTVYFCEHDCLMPTEHFELNNESNSCYFYNTNNWRTDYDTGRTLYYVAFAVSGLIAHRELLIEHYRKRVARVIAAGRYERCIGYEPGCHKPPRGIDNYPALSLRSDVPYIDIRHGKNLSKTRWAVSEFRDKNTCLGWTESDSVPGWPGKTLGRMADFLRDVDAQQIERVA